jgi:hypothetical protein
MNFTDILTWVILLIFVYLIYLWFFAGDGTTTLSRLHDATQPLSISPTNIPSNPTSNFTFSICYYVDDWNYRFGDKKVIFERLNGENCKSKSLASEPCAAPRIEFDPTVNDIVISLATFQNPDSATSDSTNSAVSPSMTETLRIENVPLQKWTSLIMTVHKRAMDVYLDGKLVKTKILDNVPNMNNTTSLTLTPGGGFSGSTANFLYHPVSLNPREAYNLYKEGCGSTSWLGSVFDRYRLKLSFLKDNQVVNSFQI